MFSTYPPHAAAWFRVAAFKWGWGRNGEWRVEMGSSCDAYCVFQIYRLNLWRWLLLATNSAKQLLFDIVSIFYTIKYNQYVVGRGLMKIKNRWVLHLLQHCSKSILTSLSNKCQAVLINFTGNDTWKCVPHIVVKNKLSLYQQIRLCTLTDLHDSYTYIHICTCLN